MKGVWERSESSISLFSYLIILRIQEAISETISTVTYTHMYSNMYTHNLKKKKYRDAFNIRLR